jgi:hypothetical protein
MITGKKQTVVKNSKKTLDIITKSINENLSVVMDKKTTSIGNQTSGY